MSKMGNHRVDLQERPQYHDGVMAAQEGQRRDSHPYPVNSVERSAFVLGWDDSHDAAHPSVEP